MTVPTRACADCGATFPASGGPSHEYIGGSPECWALYSALVAGQVPGRPLQADDALLVDAYAAQHHGVPSPQAIQSVAVHLLVLHGVFRRGLGPAQALWVRRRALRRRGVFAWLDPPSPGRALTILDLVPGTTGRSTADYARSVLETWEAVHGATIAHWYDTFVVPDRV